MRFASPRLALTTLFTLLLVLPPLSAAHAQMVVPDTFKNLKVLPRNITKDQLLATMRSFSQGLGVRCDYCHAEKEGQPAQAAAPSAGPGRPPQLDFASDRKDQKRIARGMLKMVKGINDQYLAKIKELADTAEVGPRVQVHCVTCHHGVALPQPLSDVLAEDVSTKGTAAAVKHYQQLKTQYYGSGAYDFREGSLDAVATQLTADKRPDDALAILDLAAQEFPQSGFVPFLQGEALLQKGDKAGALAKYQHALELQPRNEAARRRIAELQGTGQ